ncbi:MAG: hypothetical protein WD872_09610 [Pirellulaceae bacterium]
MRPFQFDLSTLPDDDLGALGNWLLPRFTTYPAFAPWLSTLLGGEALRRQEGQPPAADVNHYLPAHWGDLDLADALEGSTALSFAQGVSPATGKLLDTIVIHVAGLAARRLRERHAVSRSIREN